MACTCLRNLPEDFLFYIAARVALFNSLHFSLYYVTTLSIEKTKFGEIHYPESPIHHPYSGLGWGLGVKYLLHEAPSGANRLPYPYQGSLMGVID